MYKKYYFLTLTIIWATYSSVFAARVLNVTGVYEKNKYMDSHVILAYDNTGPKMCVKKCMMNADCNAVNFYKTSFICQLLSVSYPGDVVKDNTGVHFTEIGNWIKDADACWPNGCPSGTVCYVMYGNEPFCHEYTTPCDNYQNDCQNGGECVNDVGRYICKCQDGYYGEYCEGTPCTESPCQHGTCAINGASFVCNCHAGHYGTFCENTPCTSQPCTNDGSCSVSGSGFSCSCPNGYSGTTCENTPCTPQPCKNGGSCSVSGSSFSCSCPHGYSGSTCETTPCSPRPCNNGGTCSISGSGYNCNCLTGYSGTTCEQDPCFGQPCKNGGTCVVSGSTYSCNCPAGYSGNRCEGSIQ